MLRIEPYTDTEFESAINRVILGPVLFYTGHVFEHSIYNYFADEQHLATAEEANLVSVFANFVQMVSLEGLETGLGALIAEDAFLKRVLNCSHFPLGYTKAQCYELITEVFRLLLTDDICEPTIEQAFYIVSALNMFDMEEIMAFDFPQTRDEFVSLMLKYDFMEVFGKRESDIIDELIDTIENTHDLDDDGSKWALLMRELFSSKSMIEKHFDKHLYPGLMYVTPAAYKEFSKINSFPWEENDSEENE